MKSFRKRKESEDMTEAEKLDAGLEYDFWDEEVDGRKLHALEWCQKLNAIPMQNT